MFQLVGSLLFSLETPDDVTLNVITWCAANDDGSIILSENNREMFRDRLSLYSCTGDFISARENRGHETIVEFTEPLGAWQCIALCRMPTQQVYSGVRN